MTILRRYKDGTLVGEALISDKLCWIDMIEVKPGHKFQSHGTELLHEAETRLLSCGCAEVRLLSLPAARGFYRKNGYTSSWWAPSEFHKGLIRDSPKKSFWQVFASLASVEHQSNVHGLSLESIFT